MSTDNDAKALMVKLAQNADTERALRYSLAKATTDPRLIEATIARMRLVLARMEPVRVIATDEEAPALHAVMRQTDQTRGLLLDFLVHAYAEAEGWKRIAKSQGHDD